MISFFKRGALLLPLFFLCFSLSAASSLSDYYAVFYQRTEKYHDWFKTDKNDSFKEIFARLHNMPVPKSRKFANVNEFKEIQGLSGKNSYLYLYIEIPNRTNAEILFYGIKKGEISVNGKSRGSISLKSDMGYAVLKGTYEKGIYFVSVRIDEKNDITGISVLSDKKLKSSEKHGFTKSASSSLTVKNHDRKETDGAFSSLFGSFCFPYFENVTASKDVFFGIAGKNAELSGNTLISQLYSSKNDKKSLAKLKKAGFSDKNITLWQKNFQNKEVCGHE